jgi:IS30 family transposase
LKHNKITKTERKLIAKWLSRGLSNGDIAKLLGRHKCTIGREITRNLWKDIYEPLHAERVAEERKQKAWKVKHPLKNKQVFRYVIQRLIRGWSPEQIAGRLKKQEYKDDPYWQRLFTGGQSKP